MNDGIREILENQASGGYKDLKPLQAQYIIDYITNLQKENDDLKNRLENAVADCNLRLQENERLKEENKHIFANVNDDELLRSNAMNWAEAQDYKSRVEKADEYICKQKKKMYKSRNKIALFILMKLENILQNGSDDNE